VLALSPITVAGGALELRFDDGVPLLSPAAGRTPEGVALNGRAAGPTIELLRGDRIEGTTATGARFQLEAL
jgi:hypothetical protein